MSRLRSMMAMTLVRELSRKVAEAKVSEAGLMTSVKPMERPDCMRWPETRLAMPRRTGWKPGWSCTKASVSLRISMRLWAKWS